MSLRRQFQSCDYCRQRRKKCDAGALGIDPFSVSAQKRQSCSTCAKSLRTCTFNWLKEHKLRLAFLPPRTPKDPRKKKTPEQHDATTLQNIASISDDGSQDRTNPAAAYLEYPNPSIPMLWSYSSPLLSTPCPFVGQPQHLSCWDNDLREQLRDGSLSQSLSYESWSAPEFDWNSVAERSSAGEPAFINGGQILTNFSVDGEATDEQLLRIPTASSGVSTRTTTSSRSSTNASSIGLADDRVAAMAGKRGITDVLLMVYRSNLEDVLSSWSNPTTCPYVIYQYCLSSSDGLHCSTFYERARQLDSSLAQLKFGSALNLSTSNNHLATQVLNKVVLAFASQWNYSASGSRRETSRSPDDILAQQLHVTMHKTLW